MSHTHSSRRDALRLTAGLAVATAAVAVQSAKADVELVRLGENFWTVAKTRALTIQYAPMGDAFEDRLNSALAYAPKDKRTEVWEQTWAGDPWGEVSNRLGVLSEACCDVGVRILDTPCHGYAGLLAKLRVVAFHTLPIESPVFGGDVTPDEDYEHIVFDKLLRQVEALASAEAQS